MAAAAVLPPEVLFAWAGEVAGGRVVETRQVTGGNRYCSWAIDVETADGCRLPLYLRYQMPRPPSAEPYTVAREAEIYRAISGSPVKAPRLIAVHPGRHAILTERAPGRADFRRLADPAHRVTVVQEFIAALAELHRLDIARMGLEGFDPAATIADHVGREIAIWRAMYAETGRSDPLVDLALAWLDRQLPRPDARPVLVHGDAGPGNFLFDAGHMTALLDWELAHLGDPMEDLAWFSMRCAMEPVPGFADRIAEYEQLMGRAIDRTRILYHRVLVSTRVVIIRHRNVTGEPGNSIVSRALNRRLLIDALAAATGVPLPAPAPIDAVPTARTSLYDGVIEDLRREMAERSSDPTIVASAKNAAKVLKYLRACDHLGPAIETADMAALTTALGHRPQSVAQGEATLVQGVMDDSYAIAAVLPTFAGIAQRAAQLAAASSGGIAGRTFPELP